MAVGECCDIGERQDRLEEGRAGGSKNITSCSQICSVFLGEGSVFFFLFQLERRGARGKKNKKRKKKRSRE